MEDPETEFISRGVACVWGRHYRANAAWLGGSCRICRESITIRALGFEHIHAKREIVELRWVWLPWPDLVVVSRADGEYRFSTFQLLRWSRLRAALDRFGYSFSSEIRYYSVRLVRQDISRYQLTDS